MMKWNHLPRTGGINEQDPEVWEMFDIIWSEQAKEEERKAKEQQKSANKPGGGISKRPRRKR